MGGQTVEVGGEKEKTKVRGLNSGLRGTGECVCA